MMLHRSHDKCGNIIEVLSRVSVKMHFNSKQYQVALVGLFIVLQVGQLHLVAAEIEDLIGSLINSLIGQKPNNINGDASQYRARAIGDRSNSDIYDSTTQEIIKRSGFKQRTYRVVSDDGYITQLINLINPLADKECLKQPPVMLFHGGLGDPSAWVWGSAIQHHPEMYPRTAEDGPITSSNRSLAFMLANNGYDVWLIGTRGSNRQNLDHSTYKAKLIDELLEDLSTSNKTDELLAREFIDTIKYYDYSFDELVDYEYPKQIQAVLKLTGSKTVNVVAISFGTPVMFKILSSNKAISDVVHSYVALSPLLNKNGSNRVVKFLVELAPKIPRSLGTVLVGLILSKPVRNFLRKLSRYRLYKMITTLFFGPSPKYLTFLEDPVVGHLFLATGFKEVQHYAQMLRSADLQKFDYGPMKNSALYGSSTPPKYDLNKFNVKRWMIATGANDVLGTPSSGDQYFDMIPAPKPYRHLNIPNYNHVDMVAAFDNDVQINSPVMQFFDRFHIEKCQHNMSSSTHY